MEIRSVLDRLIERTPLLHALYFTIGGIWSVVGKRSFQAISGSKTDYWLVRTVGGLLTVVGVVVGMADARGRTTPEIRWLAIGTSGVLTLIDLIYTGKNRIRNVYLLDAVANLVLISGWLTRQSDDIDQDQELNRAD
jgi:hypothetical protein